MRVPDVPFKHTPDDILRWTQLSKTIVFAQHGDAPDAAWRHFLQMTVRAGPPGAFDTMLIWSRSGAPSARQRAFFKEMAPEHLAAVANVALLTDSLTVRAAMATFGWLTPMRIRCFALNQRREAVAWVAARNGLDVVAATAVLNALTA